MNLGGSHDQAQIQAKSVAEELSLGAAEAGAGPMTKAGNDVRFEAHYGLKSDIAPCPKSANKRHRSRMAAQSAAPLMAEQGKGAIVNVSTMVADYGAAGLSLYGSSKAAVNLLTQAWEAEYGPKA